MPVGLDRQDGEECKGLRGWKNLKELFDLFKRKWAREFLNWKRSAFGWGIIQSAGCSPAAGCFPFRKVAMHHLVPMGWAAIFLIASADGLSRAETPTLSKKIEVARPSDPAGWRNFQWGMTKEQAQRLGAQTFQDREGAERFGLPEVELLPGENFWVDLQFYSHIKLASILIHLKTQGACGRDAYEALLQDLRKKYGPERESKNLDYPNAWFLSHVWIVETTKITLKQGCNKPGSPTSSMPSTRLRYEKRMTIELWNR